MGSLTEAPSPSATTNKKKEKNRSGPPESGGNDNGPVGGAGSEPVSGVKGNDTLGAGASRSARAAAGMRGRSLLDPKNQPPTTPTDKLGSGLNPLEAAVNPNLSNTMEARGRIGPAVYERSAPGPVKNTGGAGGASGGDDSVAKQVEAAKDRRNRQEQEKAAMEWERQALERAARRSGYAVPGPGPGASGDSGSSGQGPKRQSLLSPPPRKPAPPANKPGSPSRAAIGKGPSPNPYENIARGPIAQNGPSPNPYENITRGPNAQNGPSHNPYENVPNGPTDPRGTGSKPQENIAPSLSLGKPSPSGLNDITKAIEQKVADLAFSLAAVQALPNTIAGNVAPQGLANLQETLDSVKKALEDFFTPSPTPDDIPPSPPGAPGTARALAPSKQTASSISKTEQVAINAAFVDLALSLISLAILGRAPALRTLPPGGVFNPFNPDGNPPKA